MLRRGFFPEGEVGGIVLGLLSVEGACGGQQLIDIAAAEASVSVVAIEFGHVEVDVSVADVCVSGFQNFLYILDLLDDVSRGERLDAGRQHVECFHIVVVAIEVVLYHFHRLELFEASLLCNFVFAVVCIVFQVSDVGDVAHIAYLVSQVAQIAQYDVKSYGGAGVTQVCIAVHRRTTDVHTHERSVQRLERLLAAAHRVVDAQVVGAYTRKVGTHRLRL